MKLDFELFFLKDLKVATLKFPFTEIMEVGETAKTRFPVKAPAENRQLLTGGKFLLANCESDDEWNIGNFSLN